MARDSELHIGQWVNKVGGRYGGPGRIVGDTMVLDDDGYKLWNVEHRIEGGYGKFCHVYPSSVLVPAAAPVAELVTPAAPTPSDHVGATKRIRYHLEWISGARPPVHPSPMTGRNSFESFDAAIAHMRRQAPDAQFVSLEERTTVSIDRSEEARAALATAAEGEAEMTPSTNVRGDE